MKEHKDYYSGTAWTDPKAWDVLVEMAKGLVRCADAGGEGCDYANAHVSSWSPRNGTEMRYVVLTFSLDAKYADAAMARAGVQPPVDPLGEDQAARFALLELD